MPTKIDLSGQKFGRLNVLRDVGRKWGKVVWKCECDCGNVFEVLSNNLKSGNTKSCGCLHREKAAERGKANKTHGHHIHGKMSRTYNSWRNMKTRCTSPNKDNYHNYGGRGISICDRWFNSFENFLQDMGERPEGKTLDRIDPHGNYTPDNCRWATPVEQNNNKRKSKK